MSDYICYLIRREQLKLAREDLERKLINGLGSGQPTEMTPEDWKELREGLRRRADGSGG